MELPEVSQRTLGEMQGRIREWVTESRRRRDTWLVTKGCILKPPFRVEGKSESGLLHLKIAGTGDALEVGCNRVVDSPFREELGLFVQDAGGAIRESCVVAPLARHFQLILTAFPPNSRFGTAELYTKITWSGDSERSQAHARRRWKELKYNYGFDLDWDGKMYWRGESETPVRQPELRPDDKRLNEVYWDLLASKSRKRHNDAVLPRCEYCDAGVISRYDDDPPTDFDSIGLIDHRRPVFQGGDDSAENLQILCQTCNNIKNSTCRRCPYAFRCGTCVWGYPERLKSRRLVLHLDPDVMDALVKDSAGGDVASAVMDIIRRNVHPEDPHRS